MICVALFISVWVSPEVLESPEVDNIRHNTYCLLYRMEKAMAPHSSALAWRIPWTEEPGRLQSMGLLRVGHD